MMEWKSLVKHTQLALITASEEYFTPVVQLQKDPSSEQVGKSPVAAEASVIK
jgi:hypothetical protein